LKYSETTPRRHNPLLHRVCPKCDARMWLTVIEPAKPGHDKLVYECTECGREEFIEVMIDLTLREAA
jgi:hypothetical protein